MTDSHDWVGTAAASAYLGITPATLGRLVLSGSVVAYQVGRVRRYRVVDLDRFLQRARIRPTRAEANHEVASQSAAPSKSRRAG